MQRCLPLAIMELGSTTPATEARPVQCNEVSYIKFQIYGLVS